MKCPTCHNEIPDGKHHHPRLACPACLAEKSYRAILDAQRHVIARLLSGAARVKLTKPAEAGRWHIVLGDYDQAWCGWETSSRWEAKRLAWPGLDGTTPVCERCREVFEKLAKESPTEAA